MTHSIPELLAPVSTLETCHAAVHNGANAIYLGAPHWNARGRTPDLTLLEIRDIIEFCRLRNVRVFLAMNVLVFESELQKLSDYLLELIQLEPDAFIIQDIGLARLINLLCPEQELHASTQMTLASAEAVKCVDSLGFKRVVLARELSVPEIRQVRAQVIPELEVFVHGALCVSYSGQCLTSESFGGRSANRGQCAQSCRLPYKLLVDNKEYDTKGRPYLFSPQDLCALDEIENLAEAGVDSLKIEGRLKSPEYVAAVTQAYRTRLDKGYTETTQKATLEALFSRGLFTGWLKGTDHQKLVGGYYSSHQGVLLGKIKQVTPTSVTVSLLPQAPLCSAGDGIVFVNPHTGQELGGRLFAVNQKSAGTFFEFRRDLDLSPLLKSSAQWQVWRNDSPALEAEVRRSYTDKARHYRVPVTMNLQGQVGEPLFLEMTDIQGHTVRVQSAQNLEAARKEGPTEWISEELQALGGSPYTLHAHTIAVKDCFIPKPIVRQLRQEATLALNAKRLEWKKLTLNTAPTFPRTPKSISPTTPALNVLIRKESQLAELTAGHAIDTIFLDFDYGKRQEAALQKIRDLGYNAGIATLRIHKSGENKYLENIAKLQPDRVLVRSLGALHWLREQGFNQPNTLIGDHSLNVCNSLTAEWFVQQGLQYLHPSWDLNRQQLLDLITQYGGQKFEVGLHFYVPTYHMEHCVFASMLSTGPRYPECKVPCMLHTLEVEDHKGDRHFLQSDAECRNTLYLGRPQSMVKLLSELMPLKVSRYRLEVLQETSAQVQHKVKAYSDLLLEKRSIESVYKELQITEKYGITEGQLFNETRWVDRKKS